MDEPPTPDQLRELIALALRADLQKAIPPWRPFPGGPPLSPGMGRTEYDLADAALAVVQPELDRLRAELAAADDEMTAVMLHNDQTCEAVAERDRLRAELEQARAQLATVAAAEGAARTAMEAVLLVPDRDPDAADSSSERHTRIGYNDALSDVRDAIGTTAFEPRPTRDQARAEAFNEAIDRFKSLANLAPDAERAPGLNFAIGALMSMRARTARES